MTVTESPESTTAMATVRNCSEVRQMRRAPLKNRLQRTPSRVGQNLTACACTITDPAHGHHDGGVVRIFLDLGPQPLHVYVHQTRIGLVVVTPHLLEQHLAREDLL